MFFQRYAARILPASVVSLSLIAIPVAHTRGQETPTALSGPSFHPDGGGSTLAGWHTLGKAAWSADHGEIVGKGTGGSGWLVLDRSFQDAGLYASFQCEGSCDTGVLLRLRPTPDGMQGTFLAIKDSELKGYNLTLGKDGNPIQQKPLRSAGGQIRFAPPPPDPSAPVRPFPTLPSAPQGVTIPITRPRQGIREGEWNEIELLLDADILRVFMNNGGGQASVATEEMNGYGPVALYVGKDCEVRFKNVAYKDLAIRKDLAEEVGTGFRMQRLSPFYYGWSAAAADFNRDGKMDIVSGPFIYFGPDYLTSREIYPAEAYNASTQYSMNDWVEHAYDFTGDGWPDVLTTSHAAVLYWYKTVRNPKAPGGAELVPHLIHNRSGAGSDVLAVDLNGDGRMDIVTSARSGTYIFWGKPADKGAGKAH